MTKTLPRTVTDRRATDNTARTRQVATDNTDNTDPGPGWTTVPPGRLANSRIDRPPGTSNRCRRQRSPRFSPARARAPAAPPRRYSGRSTCRRAGLLHGRAASPWRVRQLHRWLWPRRYGRSAMCGGTLPVSDALHAMRAASSLGQSRRRQWLERDDARVAAGFSECLEHAAQHPAGADRAAEGRQSLRPSARAARGRCPCSRAPHPRVLRELRAPAQELLLEATLCQHRQYSAPIAIESAIPRARRPTRADEAGSHLGAHDASPATTPASARRSNSDDAHAGAAKRRPTPRRPRLVDHREGHAVLVANRWDFIDSHA